MAEARTIPIAPKCFFVQELLDDPYPIYRRFLGEGSAHFLSYGQEGLWAVFSYAECSTAIRDPRLSAKRAVG